MILLTEFTVLLERRKTRRLVGALITATMLVAALFGARAAVAGPLDGKGYGKVARDLQVEMSESGPRPPSANWARDIRGVRHVQAIVVTDGSDPDMEGLRKFVMRTGGSVHAVFPGLNAVTVQVSAGLLQAIAERPEVVSVSPNRTLYRTASTLETITGAVTSKVRTYSGTSYSGLDGSGIGIAVLDSGVMRSHTSFLDGYGASRVQRNVTMLNSSLANWATGVDASAASLQPGSWALSDYESTIASDNTWTHDPYGHGTHVASVAAGRGNYQAPDTTGVAPNAGIYDVRVLDGQGYGTVSDALEGIQWVIYHAREYNIRVMNLSLAAASTESWQTDPLCVAVRSAAAAGITVVAAAGNFGRSAAGQEVYGAVSSPANDPTVITVGAVNFKDTTARSDDVVNNFSSRGPTRGSYVDASGIRRVDNFLKPDLVAPGNRVFAAAATKASS